MNNIQEKDWATDSWGGHSGMDNNSEYSTVENHKPERLTEEQKTDKKESTAKEE